MPTRDHTVALDLQVHDGSPMAIIGPSGVGKTTLLQTLAGLRTPTSGRITVGERVLFDAARAINVVPEKRHIGLVFQDYCLFPHLTVLENIAFPPHCDRTHARELLHLFRIEHLAGVRPSQISGGEQQRVALARALAMRPDALLLDEPTGALDVHLRETVQGELAGRLRSCGVPTLVVTHSFTEAALLADELVVLEHGRVAQRGTSAELLAQPSSTFVATLANMNVVRGHAARDTDTSLTRVLLPSPGRKPLTAWSPEQLSGPVALLIAPSAINIGPTLPTSSVRNHCTATISALTVLDHRVRLQLDSLLTAEITREACTQLELAVGATVSASFKATATRLVQLP